MEEERYFTNPYNEFKEGDSFHISDDDVKKMHQRMDSLLDKILIHPSFSNHQTRKKYE